jgi:hypothetical protein
MNGLHQTRGTPGCPSKWVKPIILTGSLAALTEPLFWLPIILVQADFFLQGPLLRRLSPRPTDDRPIRDEIETAKNETDPEKQRELLNQVERRIDEEMAVLRKKRHRTRIFFWANVAFLGALALLVVVDSRPWLPAERLSLADGRVIVGYVLREDQSSDLVLMVDRGRTVQRVTTHDVVKREFCLTQSTRSIVLFRSPLEMIYRGHARYPACYEMAAKPDVSPTQRSSWGEAPGSTKWLPANPRMRGGIGSGLFTKYIFVHDAKTANF